METNKIVTVVFSVIGILILIGLVSLLLSWPFMLLWNACLVGTVAGISPLTNIWHAWGILILASFLFKSNSSSKS